MVLVLFLLLLLLALASSSWMSGAHRHIDDGVASRQVLLALVGPQGVRLRVDLVSCHQRVAVQIIARLEHEVTILVVACGHDQLAVLVEGVVTEVQSCVLMLGIEAGGLLIACELAGLAHL